jgi:hypothetical protein
MTGGSPVGRQWLVIRKDGTPLVDWGDGLYQDIASGDFLHLLEKDISHSISDDELDQLKVVGLVMDYNASQVYMRPLPERPTRTLD